MTGFNKRVYEMLVRVAVFAASYPQHFAKGTASGELIGSIEAAVQSLAMSAASQMLGKGDLRRTAAERAKARKALRDQLETISRFARSMNLAQFWMPRDRGDLVLLTVANSFLQKAELVEQQFLDNQMPEDFLEKLKTAIQDLQATIKEQTFSRGASVAATASIDRSRNVALASLQRLDPIMESLLRDDPPALAAWYSARHIPRYSVSKTAADDHTTASVPPAAPVTISTAAGTPA